ncbi:hypothetical protein [Rhodococcoides kroppenstedtii]|uniref:hypothetical protein n=1 Tax=Rhodococcoides kroppenstedtii TaxID=293050 RepID=UPI0036416EE2
MTDSANYTALQLASTGTLQLVTVSAGTFSQGRTTSVTLPLNVLNYVTVQSKDGVYVITGNGWTPATHRCEYHPFGQRPRRIRFRRQCILAAALISIHPVPPVDGDPVTKWPDTRGGGADNHQTFAASQPIYKTNV